MSCAIKSQLKNRTLLDEISSHPLPKYSSTEVTDQDSHDLAHPILLHAIALINNN